MNLMMMRMRVVCLPVVMVLWIMAATATGQTPGVTAPSGTLSNYVIGGKNYKDIKNIRYANRRLIFESDSGYSSLHVEELQPGDLEGIPAEIVSQIKADIPLLVERLNDAEKKEGYFELDQQIDSLTLGGKTIQKVHRIVLGGGRLAIDHATGRFNLGVTQIGREDFQVLPAPVQERLAGQLFYFRPRIEAENIKKDSSFSGRLDKFIREISIECNIVLSIDPLVSDGVIPRNVQANAECKAGGDIAEVLGKVFQSVDRRLGVFHVAPGVYFVSLKDSETLQRSLLAFLDADFAQAQEWIRLAGMGGTVMDRYVGESTASLLRIQALQGELDTISRMLTAGISSQTVQGITGGGLSANKEDIDRALRKLKEVDEELSKLVQPYFESTGVLSMGNPWAPVQIRLVVANFLSGVVRSWADTERLSLKYAKNGGSDESELQQEVLEKRLGQARQYLMEAAEREKSIQIESLIPRNAATEMRREDFDRIKLLSDSTYANRWNWDTRVLAGTLNTVGRLITEREFDSLLAKPAGSLSKDGLGRRELIQTIRTMREKHEGLEALSRDWQSDLGLATGLVVATPRRQEIYGDTFIFAVDRQADAKGAISVNEFIKGYESLKSLLDHFYYLSIESNIDPYALGSMKSAILWATQNKKSAEELKLEKNRGYNYVLKLEQGLGVNLGGDSGGAAWATAIYSRIMGKPILSDIAITGTIGPEGQIGAVGGVYFKVNGAMDKRRAAVFFPSENKDELNLFSAETYLKIQLVGYDRIEQLHAFTFEPSDKGGEPVKAVAKPAEGEAAKAEPPKFIHSFAALQAVYGSALYHLDSADLGRAKWCLELISREVANHYTAEKLLEAVKRAYPNEATEDEFLVELLGPPKQEESKVEVAKPEVPELTGIEKWEHWLLENWKYVAVGLVLLFFLMILKWFFGRRY